jgi:hypothetical protein
MDDAPTRNRRWFRNSRRWPLLLALLLAIPCSWFGLKMEYAARQKEVIEELENLGGLVWYDYQFDADGMPGRQDDDPPGPVWLRRLLGDDFFMTAIKLDLTQTEVGDGELEHLKGLTQLQTLSLGERVSDAGLAHLKGLPQLQSLDLRAAKVSDAAISNLQKALPLCTIKARDRKGTP